MYFYRELFDRQNCIIFIDHIIVSCNYDVANLSMNVVNDGTHDTLISASAEYFAVVDKMIIQLKLNVAENEDDMNYRRELLSTTVNVQKLIKGVEGDFVVKTIMANYIKSADFELKMPINKVSNF